MYPSQAIFKLPKAQESVLVQRDLKILLIIFSLSLVFVKNGGYLFCGFLVLFYIIKKFWKPYQPSIFLFCFIFQWMQIIAYVFWMNNLGYGINDRFRMSSVAFLESLAGLTLMAWIISKRIRLNFSFTLQDLVKEALKWDKKKVLILYVISTAFLSSIGFVLGQSSGLAQILITLQGLKWIFFVVYGFILWSTKGNKTIFWVICAYEFLVSFYSYFSDFKVVIFYLILIILSFTRSISFKNFMKIIFSGFVMAFVFMTWTAIKGEYRNYLSSGKRQQIVTVSREDAFSNISDQLKQLNMEKYEKSISFSLYRIQYIFHLAKVMERIPAIAPHENGNLWLSNIQYVLLPRAFFPEKEIFDPSLKTNKYTGLKYATGKMGVSFSLGYFAESYVDFGHILMFLPLILIALFISWIYNFFMSRDKLNLFLRYGIVITILFTFSSFESDGTYMIGRLFISTVVMSILTYALFPVIQKWAYRRV